MVERLKRIFARHRPAERFQIAEVLRKTAFHHRHHVAGYVVRLEAAALGERCGLRQGLAVVVVEIPLAALRLIARHEEARGTAHLAVEELHAKFLAALGPQGKAGRRGEEAVITADVRAPFLHHLGHAPFARFGDGDLRRLVTLHGALHFGGERPRVRRIIERHIIDAKPLAAKLFREVAHGGEDQRQLLLVMIHVGGFFHHLHHQHHVSLGVTLERR